MHHPISKKFPHINSSSVGVNDDGPFLPFKGRLFSDSCTQNCHTDYSGCMNGTMSPRFRPHVSKVLWAQKGLMGGVAAHLHTIHSG